jgi:hypothetical protein
MAIEPLGHQKMSADPHDNFRFPFLEPPGRFRSNSPSSLLPRKSTLRGVERLAAHDIGDPLMNARFAVDQRVPAGQGADSLRNVSL